MEGISERYLQKLFEGTGDNFTHYLRERGLQHCLDRFGQPRRGASFRVRHRLRLRLQRRGPFQPLVSRPVRNVTAGVPANSKPNVFQVWAVKTGQRGWLRMPVAQLRAHRPAPVIAAAELKLVDCAVSRGGSLRIIFSPWMRRAFTGAF